MKIREKAHRESRLKQTIENIGGIFHYINWKKLMCHWTDEKGKRHATSFKKNKPVV